MQTYLLPLSRCPWHSHPWRPVVCGRPRSVLPLVVSLGGGVDGRWASDGEEGMGWSSGCCWGLPSLPAVAKMKIELAK